MTNHLSPYEGGLNEIITFNNKTYYVIVAAIYGGSGMAAEYPYDYRYYLVSKSFWDKNRNTFFNVHDSILPEGWAFFEKEGTRLDPDLLKWNSNTESALTEAVENLDKALQEKYGEKIL